MAENEHNLKLDNINTAIRDRVKSFAVKLTTDLVNNLESITITGSSLTNDFRAGKSDINSVLVLAKLDLNSLNVLVSISKTMARKKIAAPLLMTKDYIERSLDVFSIELLDIQLTHETVLGDDPFASLTFAKTDVRLQCERELKAMLIRLRHGYIASAGDKRLLRDILISTVIGTVPLLRAMLWLKDVDRPRISQAVLEKAAGEFSIETDSLIRALKWRNENIHPGKDETINAYEPIYETIERLSLIVDKLEV